MNLLTISGKWPNTISQITLCIALVPILNIKML